MVQAFVNRFLHWLTVGIMSTVLSLSLLSRGITEAELGLLLGAYSTFVVLLELPSGILTDLWGRKRAYLASLAASALGYLALLGARGFFPLLVSLGALALGRAFSSGSIEALFIAQAQADERPRALEGLLRLMGLGETLGLALGALLGGLLPGLWDGLFPHANRYDANLLAQVAVVAGLFGLTLLGVAPDRARPARGQTFPRLLRQGITQPLVVPFLAAALAWGFAFGGVETWWQPRLGKLLGSTSQTWIFGVVNSGYFLAALAGVLASGLLRFASPRGGLVFLILQRLTLGAVLVFLSGQTQPLAFAVVYLSLCGFNGLSSVPEGSLFNRALPEAARSSFLSLSSLMVQLGGAASAYLSALLVPAWGITGFWLAAGVFLGASSLAYLVAVVQSGAMGKEVA